MIARSWYLAGASVALVFGVVVCLAESAPLNSLGVGALPRVKPAAPNAGGIVDVQDHPGAARGLLRINKDGSYQYAIQRKQRQSSVQLSYGSLPTPSFTNKTSGLTYESLYGASSLGAFLLDFEKLPWRSLSSFSVGVGVGFVSARGKGVLQDGASTKSMEAYSLYILPITVRGIYRLEFSRSQWFVPIFDAGVGYFIAGEKRDDGGSLRYVGTPHGFLGAGIQFGVSRVSMTQASLFERNYGLADFWIHVSMRSYIPMGGRLKFSGAGLVAGLTTDF